MLSKRRQALGIQIMACMAILIFISYFILPTSTRRAATVQRNLTLQGILSKQKHHPSSSSPVKAAFVILARNSDLHGIRSSIRQVEDRFNYRFNYPYVFLNEQEFTQEFKELTSALTKAPTHYGKIEPSMWGYPPHINQTYARECREDMGRRGIIYGPSESYRHMCRFQSGFFFRHPLLDGYEYYWRVEPDIQYFCDIDYDVFQMMKDNGYKYGWTLSLTEFMETIPSLWETTIDFISKHPEHVVKGNDSIMPWITDSNFLTYNGCHFWSNFEIGSLEFLRSKAYLDYFEHLDAAGGFFYERWGDAPVHSLAVAMMLKKSEVHFFNDIGYKHNPLMHCPTDSYLKKSCHCNFEHNFDWDGWSCATRYKNRIDSNFVWDEETYRKKTDPYRLHK